MDVNAIIMAVVVIGVLGIFIGLFLGISAIKLKVETDPRIEQCTNALPGNNCGGCGYAGCSNLAEAIVNGEAPVNACPVGGDKVGKEIAKIMGQEAEDTVKQVAYVKCKGDCEKAGNDYNYQGIDDCRMLSFVPNGGAKSCNYGCLGFGSCVKVCPFNAISVVNGVAIVDKEACKACGKCVSVCPKHLIELIPYDAKYAVSCSNKDKGPVVMKKCQVGCIGCGICKKNCESDAVEVNDFLAVIDQNKCTACGTCAEKCPKKVINRL